MRLWWLSLCHLAHPLKHCFDQNCPVTVTLTSFQDTTMEGPAIGIKQLWHITYPWVRIGRCLVVVYKPKSQDRDGGPGRISSGDLKKYRLSNIQAAPHDAYTMAAWIENVASICVLKMSNELVIISFHTAFYMLGSVPLKGLSGMYSLSW